MNNTWALTNNRGEIEYVSCRYIGEAVRLIGWNINDIADIDLIDSDFGNP